MTNQVGTVFWVTGLSGSGKTTLSEELVIQLRKRNYPVIFLDGDQLRHVIGDCLGMQREDRLTAGLIYARLCNLLASQKVNVVCATIALFHEVQEWNRNNISRYIEIFLDVPLTEIVKRDSKKIYARAESGELKNVVGVDIIPEYPKHPDVVLTSHDQQSFFYAVTQIINLFEQSMKVVEEK